jgi:hypothetical protein
MGEVVNLRNARKRAMRRDAAKRADENRLLHGRSKTERVLEKTRAAKSGRELDQHKLETGEG